MMLFHLAFGVRGIESTRAFFGDLGMGRSAPTCLIPPQVRVPGSSECQGFRDLFGAFAVEEAVGAGE